MPLFMDLHKAGDYDKKPTVEDIKQSHIADLAVQHKYGVKFLQYWINEEAGLVFCLMEGPDAASCAAVHQEAHGNMPCNVIELQGGDYRAFMEGEIKKNEFDIVETSDGQLDTGHRVILAIDIIAAEKQDQLKEMIHKMLHDTRGRYVNRDGSRETIVFNSAGPAIEFALKIVNEFEGYGKTDTEIRIGISAGEPVTEQRVLFADAIQLANRLCDMALDKQLVISPLVKRLAGGISLPSVKTEKALRILNTEDEKFLQQLSETISNRIAEPGFNIDTLSKLLGLSKSQLYRKIISLTGRPANDFIRELRLQKAYKLISDRYGNVSEVAFATGFSSPSYFTRSFQKRFNILPLQVSKNG
jgi:AraC-like DNA-binding protein